MVDVTLPSDTIEQLFSKASLSMNSGSQSPRSISSHSTTADNRQRLIKDVSVSDLANAKHSPPSTLQQRHDGQPSGGHHTETSQLVTPSNTSIKKLKDHFQKVQESPSVKQDGAQPGSCRDGDRDAQEVSSHYLSIDNSEQTETRDNTTHSRLTKALQTVPTAKIVDEIIRTLEKNVQRRKKLEKKRKKKLGDKSVNGNQTVIVKVSEDKLSQSLPNLEENSKEKRRKVKSQVNEGLSRSLSSIETKVEARRSHRASPRQRPSTPTSPDQEKLQRVQHLKEKLAGSLERIECLIDHRLSNRVERANNLLVRSDSETIQTIVTYDSTEPMMTKRSEVALNSANQHPLDSNTNTGNISSESFQHDLSSLTLEHTLDRSTSSPHNYKRPHHHGTQTRSPHTPISNSNVTPRADRSRLSFHYDRTPNAGSPYVTPSRLILPDVYKAYTGRTKGAPLTSPTTHSRTPTRHGITWKSPSSFDRAPRTAESNRKGKCGLTSLANFLEDIQDLLLDDLYSIGTSIDERSTYSLPVTRARLPSPIAKARERDTTECTHIKDEEDSDMLTNYLWSSSANPIASHRKQARECFWEDYRKSRLPMTDRQYEGRNHNRNSRDRQVKPSVGYQQNAKNDLYDELLAKHKQQSEKKEKKHRFARQLQRELWEKAKQNN